MKDYKEAVKSWIDGNFDPETKCKVIELRNTDPVALEDAFYKNLEFGTGGLRGIMGVGTNRMNKYTVGMAIAVAAAIRGDDYLILAARCEAGEQIVHIRSGVVCGGAG